MNRMDNGDRLRVTLLDRMSTVETSRSTLTLEAILMAEKNGASLQPSRSQSLVEIMQREEQQRHNHSRDKTAEGRVRLGDVLAEEETPPARMSLIELLVENQGPMSLLQEDRVSGGGEPKAEKVNCCVCMIRSKGAAFIPCGHTFCRLCSTELWVQRGNCPLCNTSILDILHLF